MLVKQLKNKVKEQHGRFIGMLLGTLGASLLGNQLAELEQAKEQLEQVKVFNAVLSFN